MTNPYSDMLAEQEKRAAEEYATKSTQMSLMIEQAEAYLLAMPGKLEMAVSEQGRPFMSLSFERKGESWRLVYRCPNDNKPNKEDAFVVTSAPVRIKAAAALLLPMLVTAIEMAQNKRIKEVDRALECLSSLPFLQNQDKEGM